MCDQAHAHGAVRRLAAPWPVPRFARVRTLTAGRPWSRMKSYCTLPSRATRVSIWSLSGRWPRNSVVPGSEGWSLGPLRLKARVLPSGRAARAVECTTWRVEAALATAMHWLCTLDGVQGEVDPAPPIFLVPYARAVSAASVLGLEGAAFLRARTQTRALNRAHNVYRN